jgi:hypothetical protein
MRGRLSTGAADKLVVVFVLTSRLRRQSEGDFHSSHNPEQTLKDSSKMRTRSSTYPKLLVPPPLQRNLRPSHLRNGERAQRHGDGEQVDQQKTGSNSARNHIASFRHRPSVQRLPDPSPATIPYLVLTAKASLTKLAYPSQASPTSHQQPRHLDKAAKPTVSRYIPWSKFPPREHLVPKGFF